MSEQLLNRLMSETLAKMSVISEQKARSYEGVSVHGGERDTMPSLAEPPMLDTYLRRYNGAKSDTGRRAVVLEAVEALKNARRTQLQTGGVDPAWGSFWWKCRVADDERDIEKVAQAYGTSRRSVSRYRAQYRGVIAQFPQHFRSVRESA